jgi:hypothetical protein
MKYLAQLNDHGEVVRVIVCDSIAWAQTNLGGTWIETKQDGSQRARYAGLGYIYSQELDVFLPPQPAYNYVINQENANWTFPDGDHVYIPVDPRLIEYLSRSLYQLIAPGQNGLYAGIIWHPISMGWPLLQLRNVDVIPVSLGANTQPLVEVLAAFVQGGGITQQELDGIVAGVQAAAGHEIKVSDFIPPSWQQYILTREQAIEQGYIPQPEES